MNVYAVAGGTSYDMEADFPDNSFTEAAATLNVASRRAQNPNTQVLWAAYGVNDPDFNTGAESGT
jgi:hypothetical protein